MAANLLVGDEGEIDGPKRPAEGRRGLELADGLQVLYPHALHVLGAAGVDVPGGGVEVGVKGRVGPLVVLGGDDVGVGVEEDGGKGGVLAGPFEEEQRLALNEFKDLGFEGEGVGLGD